MKFRPVLFWIHLSLGVSAGAFLFIIASTGMLLAFRPQVTAFAERGQSHVALPTAGETRMGLDALAAKIAEKEPGTPVTGLSLSSDPSSAALFNLGRGKNLYVDPYRGEILGEGAPRVRAFFQTVENLHRWFGFQDIDREAAKQVKGAVTLLFGLMILSGFYLWWPRQWSASVFRSIGIPSTKLKGKAKEWNWHNAIGFWCAPWLLVIVLTGLIMVYPWANDLLYKLTGSPLPPRPAASQPSGPPAMASNDRSAEEKEHGNGRHHHEHSGEEKHQNGYQKKGQKEVQVHLDQLLAAVNQQAPGWKSLNLRLPQGGKSEVMVLVEEASASRSFTRGTLTLNAATGEVVKWEPYDSQSAGRKLRSWARFIHTGEAGGIFGQILTALAATGALFLIWTGLSLAWRRFR